ncbi:hypothetical protein LCGC14_1127660 [marine sediment metagenome]|uniref:Uncharacterized protein n=1 Tax=marine sediment metagenome TaxID=412755 RepID=A0A0F9M246_9ZZZZ
MTHRVVSEKERFIGLWRKEFGCTSEGLCWCDTCVRLSLLHDWLLDNISTQITNLVGPTLKGAITKNSVGKEILPSFMKNWLKEEE